MLRKTLALGLVFMGLVNGLRAADLTLDDIFPADRVLDIQITVAPEDWDTIRYQSRNFFSALNAKRQFAPIPGPYTYVDASVSIDGVKFPKVGLRKKGFIGSQSSIRPSLKVKLDFVDPEGKIEGLNNLTFNNNKQDSALVSQFMGYALFNKAGSPAPRCAFANITVNGKNLGIYSHVETYRKPLLGRGFGDKDGTLYEGTVVDFYEDWEQSFELKRGDDEAGRAKIEELTGVLNQGSGASGDAVLDSRNPGAGWVPTSGKHDEQWMRPGFDDSGWRKGVGGAGFEVSGGYEQHFSRKFDFEEEMHDQATSVYLRYPFEIEDIKKVGTLTLRMKYDDGFIAYINGHRVASANAPEEAGWKSRAEGPNDDGAAVKYQSFPVSEPVGKLRKGSNLLAIHGLNISPDSSDLLFSAQLRVSEEKAVENDIEKEIGSIVDLEAFYKFWAMEGLLGFWDGYSGNRNNFYFYLNPTTGKFHFMPWGADSLFVKYSHVNPDRRVPLSVKTGGMIANKLYQRPQSRARYKKTLQAIFESHWDEKKLLAETDRIEEMLEPYVEKYSRQRRFASSLRGVREFIRNRREELLEETSDGMPIWTKAHEPPVAIPGGGIFGRGRENDKDTADKDDKDDVGKAKDLWDAARKGDVEAVKWHLEKMGGKDAIDRKDGLGAAALSWASGIGRFEVVEYLVKNGANVNITNKEGKTPLDDALTPLDDQAAEFIAGIFRVKIDPDEVNKAKPKIAAFLRKNDAKSGAQLGGLKGVDIWAAARVGDVEALRNHAKAGVDIDKKDQFSTTALHWAVALGKVEATKYLLSQGADVNLVNGDGVSPLDETYKPWNRLAADFMRNFFRVETDIEEVNAGRKVIQPLLEAKGARRGKGAEK